MRNILLITLLMMVSTAYGSDCRSYVARLKHADGSYQDYNKVDTAANKAASGDIVLVGKDSLEEVNVTNGNNYTIQGECSNTIQLLKIQKSSNIVVKGLVVSPGKNNKSCVQIVGQNRNQYNVNIELNNLQVKNCLTNGIEVDPYNQNIKITGSRIENNNGYGILKNAEPSGAKPEQLTLIDNVIINNKGTAATGVSSKDLGNYPQILDNTDSGNQTTANNEGLGIGMPATSDLAAITGPDQTLSVGEIAKLDGASSYSLLSKTLTYSWSFVSKPAGSQATLANAGTPRPTFTVDQQGDYVIELAVNDGKSTVKDQVRISTTNSRPIAVIAPHAKIAIGDVVELDGGESSDPDQSPLNYQWTLVKKPTNSQAILSNGTTSQADFTVDVAGDYTFELQVGDGALISKKVRRTFSTQNNSPIADVGNEINSYRNTSIDLDGHNSQDPDSQVLTYKWSLAYSPVGATATITNSTQNIAQVTTNKNGLYVFNLLVSDGTLKDAKTVAVNIENRAPIATLNSIVDRVEKGALVALSGSGTDPDGDAITYQWSFLSRPTGSNAQIQNAQTQNASFTADVGGQYKIRLQVTDVFGESGYADVVVKASTRPVARINLSSTTGHLGDEIQLNGSQSSDADGDQLTYIWSIADAPAGSVANVLVGSTTPELAKLKLSKLGDYSVTLIVSDGVFDSVPVTVNFSAIEKINHAPAILSITDQTIDIGSTLKFTVSATDSDNDKIVYLVSSATPLQKNMTFNGDTGAFTFKPALDQVGSLTLSFVASDGKNNTTTSVNILVKAPDEGLATSFRGRVYDANSTSIGHDIPIIGAVVSMIGSNSVAVTDANGEFALENIPAEATTFKIDCKNANKGPDGSTYANFIELMHLIPGARNEESRPFYLPRIAGASVTQVVPNEPTVVTNQELGLQISVPKNGVVNPDGTPYTDTLSISLVPKALAPVQLPEQFTPGMLITVQPSGVKFVEPVPISYPNLDKLPPGTETNIYQIDDKTGMFGVFAKGRVTADGKRIETISGGLVNGSWGFAPPPPAVSNLNPYIPPTCSGPKCKVGSAVDLQTGALFDDVAITTYKSAGKERGFKFIYSSLTAKPAITFDPVITLPNANSFPDYVSAQLFVDGAAVTKEQFMDIRELPRAAGSKIQHHIYFDTAHLATGLYKHDILTAAHFASTVLRFRGTDNPNYGGEFGVLNNQNSPFGAGWTLDVLKSLHPHANGDVLLVRDGGTLTIFKATADGKYEIPRGEYYKLEKINGVGYRLINRESTVYNFNLDGQMISEVDRNGNETTYCYYPNSNRLQYIEDPTGKRFSFIYDSNDKLEKVVDPANRATLITHDDKGNLTRITKPDLSFREMNYNESHKLIAKTDAPGAALKKKNLIGYAAHATFYDFLPVCDSAMLARVNRPREAQAAAGNLKSKTEFDGTYTIVVTSTPGGYPYWCQERPKDLPLPVFQPSKDAIKLSDQNGNVSTYDLDDAGLMIRRFDPLNRLTQTLRDDRGNIVFEEDPSGRTKQSFYDQKNNLTQVIIGLGTDSVKVKVTYDDAYSQPLSVEQVGVGTSLFKLDTKGNIVATKDAQGSRNYYAYNTRGQVISSTDTNKNQTKLRYFSDGNLQEVEDPQGNISRFFYDLAGNIIKIVDAKNHETNFEYDVMNRLKKTTNANLEVTKFEYDFVGNLTAVIDSRNGRTEFTYDSQDRMVRRVDPRGLEERFEYDGVGNLISQTDRKGQTITYQYNAANELIKKILPDGKTTNIAYDLSGNMNSIEDDFSKLGYTYDSLNRVKTVSTDGSPYQPAVTLTNTYTKSNRTKLSSSLGDILWDYDLQNRVKSITTLSGNVVNYNYDSNGRRASIAYPNGIVTKFSYDESSRLEKIAHTKGTLELMSYTYSHDNNGNRAQMNVVSPITTALTQVNYTYDQVNQLTGATKNIVSNTDEMFTYDNLGNRLKKNNQTTNNNFDSNNRLIEDDKFTYSYDDNGNLKRKTDKVTNKYFDYIWDVENRLQFIKEYQFGSGTPLKTHTYIYDALGRRILKDSNGVVHKYIYDNGNIIAEFDNDNNLQAKFTNGQGVDEHLEMTREGQTYFYHTDGLGSVIGLTDNSGNIVQSYSYSSFGETKVFNQNGTEISSSQMIQNPFGFTGREWDYETSLYYYRARYYDPSIGRFINEDPIKFLGRDSNLFRYVKNSPINVRDANGNAFLLDDAAVMVGIVVGAGLTQGIAAAITTWQQGGSGQDILAAFQNGFVSGALAGATTLGTLAFGVQTTVGISAAIAVDFLYNFLSSTGTFNPADFVNGIKSLFPSINLNTNQCNLKK